jgi:hypothetical protein
MSSPTSTIRIDRQVEGSTHGLKPYVMILLGLAVLSFIGAFIQGMSVGEEKSFTFHPDGDPEPREFTVEEPNTVHTITVSQSPAGLPDNRGWSDVSVRVTGRNDETVLSFGSDFWRASGYDEGHWSETKSRYEMNTVFPVPGTYRLGIENVSEPAGYERPVTVQLREQRGSTIPLLVLGVIALLGGIGLGVYDNRQAVTEALQGAAID